MQNTSNTAENKNGKVVAMCVGMVLGMGGLAYASVPLYEIFCRVTGFGGTTQVAENSEGVPIIDRKVNVRFDANTDAKLNWKFRPETREVAINMGEKMVVNYKATNLSDEAITGMATFNVTPQAAGIFFNKIECFCFTDTNVAPGETLEMPVVFFVDPDMDKEEALKKLNTITLSYTFYESGNDPKEISSADKALETGNETNEKL